IINSNEKFLNQDGQRFAFHNNCFPFDETQETKLNVESKRNLKWKIIIGILSIIACGTLILVSGSILGIL
ncbi:MAG: hypothetical protein DRN27_02060, partial [Thermoplasmata archaeon]